MTLLILFVAVAAVLTFALFHTKQTILGWPAYTFWAFSGFQSYSLRTGADIYSWFAVFCLIGGLVFTALAALGFRSPGDEDATELMDDKLLEEDKREERREAREQGFDDGMSHLDRPAQQSTATQRLHARADNRRNSKRRSLIRW